MSKQTEELEVLPPVTAPTGNGMNELEFAINSKMLADHLQMAYRMAGIRNFEMAFREFEAARVVMERMARG